MEFVRRVSHWLLPLIAATAWAHQLPVDFEQVGAAWVARGPAYQLIVRHGDAQLSLSDGNGRTATLVMNILGGNSAAGGQPESEETGYRNYLTGSDPGQWRRHVRLWQKVRFPGVLDGVDIIYRGGGSQLEYDIEIAPGIDVNAVRIAWAGAEDMHLDGAGNLVLHTAAGDLVQRPALAYQMEKGERREVAVQPHLLDGILSFDLGAYDHSQRLVIDPLVDYATWFPAPVALLAVDSTGAAYVSGSVGFPILPVTAGAYQTSCGTDGECNTGSPAFTYGAISANADVFIAKFTSDGSTLVYCTYLGGSGNDLPTAMAVDSAGNVALVGTTTSEDFPVSPGLDSTINPTGPTTFAAKLNAEGSALIWSTMVPPIGATDVAVDAAGDVFVMASPGPGVYTTPGAISNGTGAYRWLGELNANSGRLLYATYVPGVGAISTSGALTVGADGTVWVAGTAPGGGGPNCQGVATAPVPAVAVGVDVQHSKITKNLSIAGSGQSYGNSVTVDQSGNVYLGGYTCDTDFPGINPSLFNSSLAGFVVELAADSGARQWTWTNDAPVWTLAVNGSGGIAAVGAGISVGQNPPSGYGTIGSLYYVDSSGNLIWNTEQILQVMAPLAVDPSGKIYALMPSNCTECWGGTAPGTPGAWETAPPQPSGYAFYGAASLLMAIDPVAGTLTVLPGNIDLSAWQPSILVTCAEGRALPVAFTVTSNNSWLNLQGNPYAEPMYVTPLPNWLETPIPQLKAFASIPSNGSFDGSFTVTAPGFVNSPLTVPVHASGGQSAPQLPPEVVIYPATSGGVVLDGFLNSYPPYVDTTIGITSSVPWITPTQGSSNAVVNFESLISGVNQGQITVTNPGDPNSPYTITVDVVFGSTGPTTPNVAPSMLSFLAQAGDSPKHASFAMSPAGQLRQSYSLAASAPWLNVSPASGSIPAIINVTADPTGLQAGTYSAQINVVPGMASNSGISIPVILTVRNSVPFNVDPQALAVTLTPRKQAQPSETQVVPVTLSGSQTASYSTNAEWTIGCLPTQSGTSPGTLALTFYPADCPSNTVQGYITFDSTGGAFGLPLVLLAPALYPLIEPGGVVNGATFAPGPVAPGSIVSIFGVDLAPSVYAASSLPLNSTPPFSVTFQLRAYPYEGGYQVGFFYASPQQWNIQIPTIPSGTYLMSIGSSPIVSFAVADTAPYVFIWNGNRAAALNVDNTLNQPNNPAAAGSAVQVFLTGQGAVDPPVNDGYPAPLQTLSKVTAPVTASIDGQPVTVLFAGLAPGFVGVGQVNVAIPDGLPPGDHQLVIQIGGVNSNQVVISTK